MFGTNARRFLLTVVSATVIAIGAAGAFATSPAKAAVSAIYPLANAGSAVTHYDSCTGVPGLGTTEAAWHFVATPKSQTDFIHITLFLNGTPPLVIPDNTWIEHPQTGDAYVKVPAGYEFADLLDGIFVVSGFTDRTQVVLSHTCGDDGSGGPGVLTAAKTAIPTFTRTYGWTLDKSVDTTRVNTPEGTAAVFNYTIDVTRDAGTDSGWKVGGIITVTNASASPLTVTLVDDVLDETRDACVVVGSPLTVPAGTLAAPGTATTAYECTYAAAPVAVDQVNQISATAIIDGVEETVRGLQAFSWPTVPTTETNACVEVTDDKTGTTAISLGNLCDTAKLKYQLKLDGVAGTCKDYTNHASLLQLPDVKDEVTVKVCVGKDLTVSKDASPSYTRTYNWDLNKAVDKTEVKQAGGTVTFNYSVLAAQLGFTDSNVKATGAITVTNPNDWEAITLTGLTDAVDNGATSCTLDAAAPSVVPASSSVNATYTCTYSTKPADGKNTATATWDKAAAFTPNGSATGVADVKFGAPTSMVNKTVTVTDTFDGGAPTILGTLTASDTTPYTSQTYNYPRTVTVTYGCRSYPNTAVVANGTTVLDQDSKTVRVCGPVLTGAKTIGFWQNKNGQAIITGGTSTLNVCNSGTWLRSFEPFKDLSATATCSQVGTYATNVIKAANAAGPSMNAMLKAQMLATALDVYFSDPALGGNKIGAPGPLGGVAIDLTKVCTDVGACLTYQNTSAAFGGAPSLTVSQLLAYGASQSNVGGSMWYSNVKSMQELAKNTFDAINNQKVFAA
jgi:hypothetical protein